MVVKQTGRDCLLSGAVNCYQWIRDNVEVLGGRIEWEKLSRVDFAMDIANLPVDSLQKLVENQQFITRATPKHELIADQRTGFDVGIRPLRMTAYDKIQEQKKKPDKLILEALIKRRWAASCRHLPRDSNFNSAVLGFRTMVLTLLPTYFAFKAR